MKRGDFQPAVFHEKQNVATYAENATARRECIILSQRGEMIEMQEFECRARLIRKEDVLNKGATYGVHQQAASY